MADEPATAQTSEPVVEPIVASMTAMGSAEAADLTATQSAIGSVAASGSADLRTSAVASLSAKGAASMSTSVAGAVLSEGDASAARSGMGLVVADRATLDHSAAGVVVTSDAHVRQGNVVVLLARSTELSEGSRVIFDWKAALLLTAVLLGVGGIAAVVAYLLFRRAMRAARHLTERMPHLPELPRLPRVPDWVHAVARLRRAG